MNTISLPRTKLERTPDPVEQRYGSVDQFRRLFEESQDAILIMTAEGVVIETNPAARDLLGYDREELFGIPVKQLLGGEVKQKDFSARIVSQGGGTGFEVYLETKSGEEIVGSLSVTVCHEEATGEPLLLCILHDVTQVYLLKRELLDLQEEERRRVGRSLHDNVGSQLVGAAISLDHFIRWLEEGREVTADQLRRVRANLADTTEHIRNLSHGLHPMRLDHAYLSTALERLAEGIDEEMGDQATAAYIESGAAPRIGEEKATHIYRIAQEATSNAIRHGRPSRVEIRLRPTSESLLIEICDDGDGFDQTNQNSEGLGIRSMRYRADCMGARLDIESAPGEGTTVRCDVPVGPDEP